MGSPQSLTLPTDFTEQGVSLAILSLTLLLTQLLTLHQPMLPLLSTLPPPMLPLLSRLLLDMLPLTLLRSPPTPTTMLLLTTTLELPSTKESPTMATVLLRDLTLSTSLTAVSRLSPTTPATMMAMSLRSAIRAQLPTPRLSLLSGTLLHTPPLLPMPLLLPTLLPMLLPDLPSLVNKMMSRYNSSIFMIFMM